MNLQTFFSLYAISIPIFFVIDLIWLGLVASNFYRNRLGDMLEISWVPAIIFYLVFLVGLTVFATYPALSNGGWRYALLYGALFGFFTYATYDLTNLATLKDWPLSIVVVDMLWGTALGAGVATATIYLYSLI